MLSYFREAFEYRNDVELWTCGPFTDTYIPWNYGMHLPKKYVKAPDFPLPMNSINVSPYPEMINAAMPWTPDLCIFIDAGWHLSSKPKGNTSILVKTDPHVLAEQYKLPKSYCDISYSMQLCYAEPGDLYLPYAVSQRIHYPMDIPKEYDACMIGLHYPQRDQLINRLLSRQLTVHYSMGEIYDEYREAYNKARVALSWSSLNDLPARVWEGMGMRLAVLTNRVPDLANFFIEGEHYLGFNTVDEAVIQADRLLKDKEFADWMADNAYRKVIAGHTYDHRVSQILENAKLI